MNKPNKPSTNSTKTHQGFLRKLIRDVRIPPSRRLFAETLLLAVEGYITWDMVMAFYGNRQIQWNGRTEEEKTEAKPNKLQQEAQDALRNFFNDRIEEVDEAKQSKEENALYTA